MGNILMSLVPTTSTPLWTLTNRPLSNTEDRPTTDDHTNDLIFYRTVLNISSQIMTERKHRALSMEPRMKSSSTMNAYEAYVSLRITREMALVTDQGVRA